jgi:hypothetical protein
MVIGCADLKPGVLEANSMPRHNIRESLSPSAASSHSRMTHQRKEHIEIMRSSAYFPTSDLPFALPIAPKEMMFKITFGGSAHIGSV